MATIDQHEYKQIYSKQQIHKSDDLTINTTKHIFKKLFALFDKYGNDLILYCHSKPSNKIACQLTQKQIDTHDEKFLHKIIDLLGESHLAKLQQLKHLYEQYKNGKHKNIKFTCVGGNSVYIPISDIVEENVVPHYDLQRNLNIIQVGSKSPKSPKSSKKSKSPKSPRSPKKIKSPKSPKSPSASKMSLSDTFRSIKSSVSPLIKEQAREQIAQGIRRTGESIGRQITDDIEGSFGFKRASDKDFIKLSDELKLLNETSENISSLISKEIKQSNNTNENVVKFLEKITDTVNDTNKNYVKDNDKIVGLLEKINDAVKENNKLLEKVHDKLIK
jgi:hypothetical protein